MNFVGKFDAKLPVEGSVAHPVAFTHVDGASTHAPSDAIIVPDAQLLFGGDFKRSGVDLVLSNDDHELVLHDYFKGEKRAALASPDGAHLTGDLVNALTGHVEYAQADGAVAAAAAVVGHVTKLTGTATAIRNGVSIILNQGDNIDKGDVLQSGADSTLGVTFIDGTVFGLSSNARMVVNEMIYDPNGSNNSSLLSLVAGTISFVAGETAKHGDMKVDTPVATMGIRGTAVLVEIDFSVPGQNGAPSANFQVLVEPDGTTGSYILFDKNTLAPLATVNTAGTLTKISQGVVSFQAGTPLTPDEQKLITDLFTTKFGDNNTKSIDHHFTDTPIPQSLAPIKLADGTIATPFVLSVANPGGSSSSGSGGGTVNVIHIPGPPTVVTSNDAFTEHANVTGSTALDTITDKIKFADINAGDLPTVKVEFSSFTYQDAHHTDITQALSPTEQAAIKAIEAIDLRQDPGNNNNGAATWTYSFADGAFDFLGAGEKLTLTYTALVDNNFLQSPEIGVKQFTITITGTNDVPVITSSIPQTIAFVGGTSVPGGDLTAHVPTSGTISFDDPDLTDSHTVSVKLLLDGLDLPPTPLQIFEHALTASIATDSTGTGFGTVNWKLADLPVYLADFIPKGETITLTYAVTVTDSQGATSTQDITVTITGTDTPAVVWIATTQTGSAPGGLWSDAANWETGTVPTANDDAIIITDQLIGLTPSYPVTIDAETAAVAKSLTMNDFGTSPPELINRGTLTVGGAFDMSADSIVHNSGTISVGGLMEVQDTSVLLNSGALILQQGGDFKDQSTVANTEAGSVEISGGTLNVQVDVTNDGLITVDSGAALTVGIAAITGGTVTNNGTLTFNGVASPDPSSETAPATGEAMLKDGTLNNAGMLHAETGAVLENENVTNTGTIEVLALGSLTLDQGTTVDNTDGTIAIDGTGTLTLDDASIDGGAINDFSTASGDIIPGDIDVTGSSTISNAHLNNGHVTVESDQTLTLDGSTVNGSTITNDGTLAVDADQTLTLEGGATISGGTLDNSGTVHIEGSSGATLDGVAVTGGGDIQIDFDADTATTPLVLEGGTTVTDGTLTVGSVGVVDVETAAGATLNDVSVINHNSIEVLGGSALILDDGTSVSNADGTVTIDEAGTLTLNDASISGGTLDNSGTIDIEGSSGATLDGVAVTGSGDIEVDGAKDTATTPLVLEGGTTITDGTLTVGSVGVLNIKTAGGATLGDVGVTNHNSIEVFGGSALTLDDGTSVNNIDGTIAIDGTGTLTLNDATITGGAIDDYSTVSDGIVAGDIDVTGSSTISNAQLNNGQVTIGSDTTLTLSGDTVSGTSFIDTADGATILIDGASTLDGVAITGGTITNTDATVTVDVDQTLTLQGGATVVGGTVSNSGTVAIEGASGATLDGVTVTGAGTIQVDGLESTTTTPLVLDDGTTITDGKLKVGPVGVLAVKTAKGATLNGVAVTNDNSIEVFAASVLALGSGTVIDNTSGIVTVDGTGALNLGQATINGGTINDYSTASGNIVAGDIDVTGSSTVSNAHLNNGQVTIGTNATLTLDGSTVTGTTFADTADGAVIQIDGHSTLTLDHATINGGAINDYSTDSGGIVAGDIDVTGSSTISNAHLNNGQVTIGANQTLTLDNDTITGTHFVDTADGAVIQIDGGTTLKLDHASIDGGTINDYSTASGGTVAGDIDVIGSSTISNAQINHGDVTIESGQTLTLDGDTVTGAAFTGVATDSIIHVDGGDTLTLNSVTVSGGGVTIGADALVKTSGDVTLTNTSVTNDGTIEITDGTLKITGSIASSAPDASGSIKIDSGAVLDLDGSDTQNVVFAGINGELQIDTSSFGGSISGLAATDQIDLSTIGFGPGTTGTYSGGVLTITDGSHSISMTLTGDYSDAHFAGASDGHGGTLITLNANDDAPVFASADKAQTGAVTELADTTGSAASDPSPAAGGIIHFTDIDLTDRPTATITQSVTWTSGTTDLSLSLTPTEISALEHAFALTQSDNTNNGAIGWSYQISDSALDFLGAGETATVTSTVLLDDHQNGHDTATVTVTIAGANDAPVLAADTSGTAGTGQHAIAELAGKIGDTVDHDSTSGTLSFTDVDLDDTHTVSQSAPVYVWSGGSLTTSQADALTAAATLALTETDSTHTGAGSVGFTYRAADNSFDFLAAGETLNVTYAVAVTDSHGASSIQPVTVTITGTNDTPVLAADTSGANGLHAITEIASKTGDTTDVDSASGTLSFTDADLSDTHTVSQGTPTYLWSGGSLTTAQTDVLTAAATLAMTVTDSAHTGTGSVGFAYSAADNSFDFLAAGETLKVTYAVTVTDSHGISSAQPVTMTITGTNDAPALAVDHSGANGLHTITELAGKIGDATDVDSASGTLSFADADLTDTHTVSHGTPTYLWSGGSLTGTGTDALTAAATLTLTETDNTGIGSGSIGFTYGAADSNFDFLAAGETLKVTYGVTVTDNHGASSIEPVTVTINGTNDALVLAADHSGAIGATLHAISELAGKTGDTVDHDSASGTLSFTDADLDDTHTLSHSGPTYVLSGGMLDTTQAEALTAAATLALTETDSTHSGAGSVSFSYSAPDSSFDFLAEGQTLTVSYSMTVTDNSGVGSSQPVTFTVTGSNDAPAMDAHHSTLSYIENQAPAAIDAALTLSDVDSATLGSATVQISGNFVAGEDVLGFTDQNGIHGSYDAVHGILTLTGTSSVVDYQAALASVTYFDSSDNPSAAPRTISFSVDDGASANSHSNTVTAAIDVTPVNDAPVVTYAAPENGAISVPENTAAHLAGISVSDVDAGTRDVTVTLALPDGSSGSLSAGNFDGVTIGGSATALTITGSLVEINTFLADTQHGVTYTPATGLIHDVTLTVTANDHGATGAGGAMDSAPQPVLLDLVSDGLPASHANLIVNGGFETGDFSGWRLGSDIGDSNAIGINFLVGSVRAENQGSGDMAHHGQAEALFGGIGDDVTLSQSQTVATNANEHYTVDFWVMNDTSASSGEDGRGSNDFSASWNGSALMPTIVNADQSSSYTEYQFDVTGVAGHSTLEFSARNDDGYWNLDDVSVREGAPDTVNQLTDETISVSGVHAGDALTVTPADSNSLGMVTAVAGSGTIEWQFAASNAQLDHLMALTQTYTVSDANDPAVAQTVAVSIGGLGHDQFVFNPGIGADTMVNFNTVSNSQGTYVGDTVELDNFSNIQSVSDVLHNLGTDAHGNAVVDLGNHDSITFQGINAATIQANAMHMFVLH
ncbi:MAG: VCBS domain-containing protein [Bradyrhizobium sp.]